MTVTALRTLGGALDAALTVSEGESKEIRAILVGRRVRPFFAEPPSDPPPPFCPMECITDYADGVLLDLLDWTFWHDQRALARGLPKQWGLTAVEIAAKQLCEAVEAGHDDDALDDAGNRLHRAVTGAKSEVWRLQYGSEHTAVALQNRHYHAEEIETSYLRGYAHTLCAMAYYFRMARSSPADGMRWCHEAARELAFHQPPKVEASK